MLRESVRIFSGAFIITISELGSAEALCPESLLDFWTWHWKKMGGYGKKRNFPSRKGTYIHSIGADGGLVRTRQFGSLVNRKSRKPGSAGKCFEQKVGRYEYGSVYLGDDLKCQTRTDKRHRVDNALPGLFINEVVSPRPAICDLMRYQENETQEKITKRKASSNQRLSDSI